MSGRSRLVVLFLTELKSYTFNEWQFGCRGNSGGVCIYDTGMSQGLVGSVNDLRNYSFIHITASGFIISFLSFSGCSLPSFCEDIHSLMRGKLS